MNADRARAELEELAQADRITLELARDAVSLLDEFDLWHEFDLAYEITEDDDGCCLACGASFDWADVDGLACPECGRVGYLHNHLTTFNPAEADGDETAADHLEDEGDYYAVWPRRDRRLHGYEYEGDRPPVEYEGITGATIRVESGAVDVDSGRLLRDQIDVDVPGLGRLHVTVLHNADRPDLGIWVRAYAHDAETHAIADSLSFGL